MNKTHINGLIVLIVLSLTATTSAYPADWDWRDVNGTNYITPSKTQNGCGSCAAFALVAMVESQILIDHPGVPVPDLSEQYLVSDCCPEMGCYGPPSVGRLLYQANGIPSEHYLPYLATQTPCERVIEWNRSEWYYTGHNNVPNSIPDLKNVIMNGPAIIKVDPINYVPERYAWSHSGTHEVCIIGWNDSESVWIFKNSAGSTWGPYGDGCGKIPYDKTDSWAHYVWGTYQKPVCERYDANNDCFIEYSEMSAAILDYLTEPIASLISQEDVQELLIWHQNENSYCGQ